MLTKKFQELEDMKREEEGVPMEVTPEVRLGRAGMWLGRCDPNGPHATGFARPSSPSPSPLPVCGDEEVVYGRAQFLGTSVEPGVLVPRLPRLGSGGGNVPSL